MSPNTVTRVDRTFGFVDISGFTAFVDTHGDAAAVIALADFRLVVRELASFHGVRVDKWLGDGAMFVCVDTAPVVQAVLDIAARLETMQFPLQLRAGVACGMVILFEADDYIGMPVNLASRLCNDANAGQTLVTSDVAAVLGDDIAKIDIGMIDVRGLADRVQVMSVSRAEATVPS